MFSAKVPSDSRFPLGWKRTHRPCILPSLYSPSTSGLPPALQLRKGPWRTEPPDPFRAQKSSRPRGGASPRVSAPSGQARAPLALGEGGGAADEAAEGAVAAAAGAAVASPSQPQDWPLFCLVSQAFSGAKYSVTALASVRVSPLKAARASGQGLDWPISIMALNLAPTAVLP